MSLSPTIPAPPKGIILDDDANGVPAPPKGITLDAAPSPRPSWASRALPEVTKALASAPGKPSSIPIDQFQEPGTAVGLGAPANAPTLPDVGEMVPNAAMPALAIANKVVQAPVKMSVAVGKLGSQVAAETVFNTARPAATGRLAAGPNQPADLASEQQAEATHPVTAGIVRGIGETAGSTVGNPTNWPFFLSGAARPLLQEIIGKGFQLGLGASAIDGAKTLHDNWDNMTPEQRAEVGTQTGLSTLLAGGTGAIQRHLGGTYEPLPPEGVPRAEALFRNLIYRAGQALPDEPTFEQANSAFRAAQSNLHPDVNASHIEDSRNLNDAWATLKNSGRFAPTPPPPAPRQPGEPPLALPGGPQPMHAITPEEITEIGDKISKLPISERPQATLAVHTALATEMMNQGKFMGPDGQLHLVANEGQANKLAQKFINEEIGRQDAQAKKTASEPVPAPPPGITLDETSATGKSEAEETPKFQKGDRVVLPKGETGTIVNFYGKDTARVQVDGGRRVPIDVGKLKAVESVDVLDSQKVAQSHDSPSTDVAHNSGEQSTISVEASNTGRVEETQPRGAGNGNASERGAVSDKDTIFARHGATALDTDDANETVAGWTSEPLDERGKAHAEKLAEDLKEHKPSVIVSSDLERAKQTADIVGKKLDIPVKTDERLRPQHVPETEGLKIGEAKKVWNDYEQNPDKKPVGGESWNEFKERQAAALKDVDALKAKGEKPLVVTHSRNLEAELGQKPKPGGFVVGAFKTPEPAKTSTAAEAPKYKFGNTQANIHPSSEAAKALESARSRISDSDLAGKGKDIGDGGNHVTIRYGIKGENTEGIKKFLSEQASFDATLGKTEKFPPSEHSDGAAVINAPIESPHLHRLNAELEKHGEFTEPSFKEYKPHATVAYVDPAKADRYVGMDVTHGKRFTVNEVAISKKDGSQEIVKLEGASEKPVVKGEEKTEDVEAIKKRIAELEAKKSSPERLPAWKQNGSGAQISERLRSVADRMDSQIDDKRREMTQNPTPKRMAEYRSRIIEADEMERTQKAMRALAVAHEAGTVPAELAALRSKDDIARLVRKGLDSSKGGYYDRIPRQDYYDKSPAGKQLQEMIEGRSGETPEAKVAKRKASEISQLEAQVQFQRLPGYFPTPKPIAERMAQAADIRSGMSVLEPSAGKGNIAEAIKEVAPDAKLDVVEQQSNLRKILELKGFKLAGDDFLEHQGHYDRIVMNPPFEKKADIEHVRHAFNLLKPGGRLVAIMSPHAEFASDKRSADFREWMESLGGDSEKLPEGAFKESGTGVASRMVTIDKPAAEPTLPGMEHVPAERAEANAEQQGKDLTEKLAEPPKSIESKAGEIEQKSPLFRDTEANPQKGLFADEAGELNVSRLGEALASGPAAIGDYIREVKHSTDIARDLQRGLETLGTAKQADILRGVQVMKTMKTAGMSKADDEAIYHHLENPEREDLKPEQDKWLDDVILPIQEQNADFYTELSKGGVPIENYVHRVVKGKGGMLDRIAQGTKNVPGQKGSLSKSAPQTKHRTYMALENQSSQGNLGKDSPSKGDRQVVSIKNGQVTAWKDGQPENLGGISHSDEGKVFEDKDGNVWTLKQATSKEIEQHTETRYYHSALASSIASNIQLGSAVRALRFLEDFKGSDEFKEIAWKGNGQAPKDWKPTKLPQFPGYYFEPRTAEVLDDYADRMTQGQFGVMDQIQRFLRAAYLINPIVHPLNVAASWSFEKGLTGFAPWKWKKIYQAGNKAVLAVLKQNDDFTAALDAGAALQSHRDDLRDINKLFFDQLSEGLDKKESWAMKVATSLGIEHGNLLNLLHKPSSVAAWTSSDILYLQAAYQYQAEHAGVPLSDALKEVGRIIPEYRVPTRIADSRLATKVMTNPLISWFGSYHYGLLNSFSETAKSALGAQKPSAGRTKAEEVGKGWDRLAMLGLLAMVVFPYIFDKEAKKATGDEHARVRRPGPLGYVDAAEQVAEHKQDASSAIQKVVTPSPITKGAVELGFNHDLFSGHQIYDPHADFGTQRDQIGRYLLGNFGIPGQIRKAETTEQKRRFLWQQAGVQFGKTRAEKVAGDIAASKVGTEAESPEDHDNRVERREALDQLRKGNRQPLEEAERKHDISAKQTRNIERRARLEPLEDTVHNFTLEETKKVLEAAKADKNEHEIRMLEHVLAQKRMRARVYGWQAKAVNQ